VYTIESHISATRNITVFIYRQMTRWKGCSFRPITYDPSNFRSPKRLSFSRARSTVDRATVRWRNVVFLKKGENIDESGCQWSANGKRRRANRYRRQTRNDDPTKYWLILLGNAVSANFNDVSAAETFLSRTSTWELHSTVKSSLHI